MIKLKTTGLLRPDNDNIIRSPEAENFIASCSEDSFLFAQSEDVTSLFKFKILSLAGKFHDKKSSPDENGHYKFNK